MTPKRMACGRRRPAGPHPGRAARGPQQRRFSPSPQPLPPGAEYRWQARPGSTLLTRGARPAPPPSRSQDADAPPPPPPPALPVTASHRRPCPARPAPLWIAVMWRAGGAPVARGWSQEMPRRTISHLLLPTSPGHLAWEGAGTAVCESPRTHRQKLREGEVAVLEV
ncbi:sulfated surface glycoprotein 185-like isoform X2 [Gallus gallus]|uniref:sulfated surface glycoprotein 185-like isoform X2 n=1 Tax=Gallus gallus TaxID=9031 RepID=UPI001F00FA71|nr:sulfated surface glycoprotein 185-like isoform X2 [Gallus gallus]